MLGWLGPEGVWLLLSLSIAQGEYQVYNPPPTDLRNYSSRSLPKSRRQVKPRVSANEGVLMPRQHVASGLLLSCPRELVDSRGRFQWAKRQTQSEVTTTKRNRSFFPSSSSFFLLSVSFSFSFLLLFTKTQVLFLTDDLDDASM